MSISPLITFKAGLCDLDSSTTPPKVKPKSTPGYIYLYLEDELIHFCWRSRSASLNSPELDLIMLPADGQFRPYEGAASQDGSEPKQPTNGRIYALKFASSSQRHLFWLQSKSQSSSGDPSYFSARDRKLGSIVDQLIQGEDVDVSGAISHLNDDDEDDGDHDDVMEDVDSAGGPPAHQRGGSGGAGPDATGGDIREEGEESREGGADGGRAASSNETSALVQNFLASLGGESGKGGQQSQQPDKPFTTLPDLLPPSSTLPVIESADSAFVDSLLSFLPPALLLLAQEVDDISSADPTSETAQAAMQALSLEQKKDILRKVLRSPQLTQSLGSLTSALRDGGLPTVSEALRIQIENGGFMRRGGMPLGGADAVEAFLDGVRKTVESEKKGEGDGGRMDTD